jgi:hypothetical protein
MFLKSWHLIGLHGDQRLMCRNLSLLAFFPSRSCFGFLLFLISYLAYPHLFGKKTLILLLEQPTYNLLASTIISTSNNNKRHLLSVVTYLHREKTQAIQLQLTHITNLTVLARVGQALS